MLIVVAGADRGAVFELKIEGGAHVIGRGEDVEISLSDGLVSQRHAQLIYRYGNFYFADLGSRNGSYVNGILCECETRLADHSELQIGDTRLRLLTSDRRRTDTGVREAPSSQKTVTNIRAGLQFPTRLIGKSVAIRDVQRRALVAAWEEMPVLILGESGTGKELIAHAIHRSSRRKDGPFKAVNAAVMRGDLLLSELFGHEAGAFTGAVGVRKGVFEMADVGTLFLDELGELPIEAQAQLLRILDGQPYTRVGGEQEIKADVRVVAATNVDLEKAMDGGAFRRDLYHRLAVLEIEVPPLRERGEDIVEMAQHFLEEIRFKRARVPTAFSDAALDCVRGYEYPGNVRELKNIVEQVALYASGDVVEVSDLPERVSGCAGAAQAPSQEDWLRAAADEIQPLDRIERTYLELVLQRHASMAKTKIAAQLGISKQTLYNRISEYGLA